MARGPNGPKEGAHLFNSEVEDSEVNMIRQSDFSGQAKVMADIEDESEQRQSQVVGSALPDIEEKAEDNEDDVNTNKISKA